MNAQRLIWKPEVIVIAPYFECPVREVAARRWMRGRCYRRRVDKKWLRRYGTVHKESMPRGKLVTADGGRRIICRSDDYWLVQRLLDLDSEKR